MYALTSTGETKCQNLGLDEFGIMYNIQKDICKSGSAKRTRPAKGKDFVAQVFKQSVCHTEGPYHWYKTSGQVAKLWCSMLQEALPFLPMLLSPHVSNLIKSRFTNQCVNNAVRPSFLQTVFGIILDGEVLLEAIAFVMKKVCVKNTGPQVKFFEAHPLLYAIHVLSYRTKVCELLNSMPLYEVQTFACAIGGGSSQRDNLKLMIEDGSFGRAFGPTAYSLAKHALTPKVLRDLHWSMLKKCNYTPEKPAVPKKVKEEAAEEEAEEETEEETKEETTEETQEEAK